MRRTLGLAAAPSRSSPPAGCREPRAGVDPRPWRVPCTQPVGQTSGLAYVGQSGWARPPGNEYPGGDAVNDSDQEGIFCGRVFLCIQMPNINMRGRFRPSLVTVA
jgi:hypothetical protein